MVTDGQASHRARARRPTNSLAVTSLVCGIVGFVGLWPALFVAIILGHRAVRQIRLTGEDGYGLAKAGLALGYLGVTLAVLGLLIILVVSAGSAVTVRG